MSRISIKAKADLPADLHPLWEKMRAYGDFKHQAGVMAHRPPIFKHVWGMLTELADEALLPKRYLELCLLTASLLNECTYCVSHHAPKLAVEGVRAGGGVELRASGPACFLLVWRRQRGSRAKASHHPPGGCGHVDHHKLTRAHRPRRGRRYPRRDRQVARAGCAPACARPGAR